MLKDDIINAALSGRKGQNPQFKSSTKLMRQRRRSAGHFTISKMINLAHNDSSLAILGQMIGMNDSDNNSQLPHSQQILNMPSLHMTGRKLSKNGQDETMTTEMEYVNFMKNSVLGGPDESFFRSIIGKDRGEGHFIDERARENENQMLAEINETNMKKI